MTIFTRRGSRSAISLVAATAATLILAPAALAAPGSASTVPTNARDCVEAKLVWVNVDFDKDTTKGGCATEFTTGAKALESAGFKLNVGTGNMAGFLLGIDDVTPNWDETKTYWGSWNGTVNSDDSVNYTYYQVGAFESAPKAGSIEAWSVGDGTQQPSLQKLPAAAVDNNASSENKAVLGIAGAIAAILAVIGGVLAALHAGVFTVPGWENFKH